MPHFYSRSVNSVFVDGAKVLHHLHLKPAYLQLLIGEVDFKEKRKEKPATVRLLHSLVPRPNLFLS